MIRTLLLLATIVAITLSACPTSNDLPGLTAGTLHPSCIGSATFTFPTGNNAGNNGGNSTVYSHRFGAPFFAVPSIAMGILWEFMGRYLGHCGCGLGDQLFWGIFGTE